MVTVHRYGDMKHSSWLCELEIGLVAKTNITYKEQKKVHVRTHAHTHKHTQRYIIQTPAIIKMGMYQTDVTTSVILNASPFLLFHLTSIIQLELMQ